MRAAQARRSGTSMIGEVAMRKLIGIAIVLGVVAPLPAAAEDILVTQ